MSEGGLTLPQIEEALVASAELVDRYGEVMLPYFEFFERQKALALECKDALERARSIASSRRQS